jgi:hypothetical protein
MKTFYITIGALALASFGLGQSGATAGKMGPDRDMYTLPKVLVIVDKGSPTAGTEGSIVNHVGFRVRDMKDVLDRVAAQHFTEANGVKLDTPYRKAPRMDFAVAFLTDPWGTRIELTERTAPSPSAQAQKPAQQ